MEGNQAVLKGKAIFSGTLTVETGLHIGAGSDFAPIGAVDSTFVRDTLTHVPTIPGSSLKGKMRTLLAKKSATGYILHSIDQDNDVIARLFGMAGKNKVQPARLQFYDLFMTEDSKELFSQLDTDTYMGEIKAENVINRLSGAANPRFIERVPAGAQFAFKLVYNLETDDPQELQEDLKTLKEGLELITYDYLGGHGSRGYGRISFADLTLKGIGMPADQESKLVSLWEGIDA